jgi:L-asparaginase
MTKQNKRRGLHVVITGGTIDFHFSPKYEIEAGQVDSLRPRTSSIVPRFLQSRVKIPEDEIHFSRACMKDSRELTDEDRKRILDHVAASPYQQVMLVHGIADMDKTRDYLATHKKELGGRTVGLVGSRMPLTEHHSDGGFMLGYAVAQMQAGVPGVHMYHPDVVRTAVTRSLDDTVFLLTGGTIDSFFAEHVDTAIPYEHSVIPAYFRDTLGVNPPEPDFVFEELCMKDSRKLTEQDIRRLIDRSQTLGHKRQIITSGTYALPDLASRFDLMKRSNDLPDSTYIFVGSMFPDDVHLNDGWFNVGYALGRLDTIDKGVYASMHGWATNPANVLKQLQQARFTLYDKEMRM